MDPHLRETAGPLSESLPPLTGNAAAVESDRCLYCYDAPCTHACPTHIDIPGFIKKVATGNLRGSAQVIYAANLLGATCARVCPVQELCEGACVLGADHNPIAIGRLQRYVMDYASAHGIMPETHLPSASGRVAVVGAGPAGLSCAGELARNGCSVTVFEKRPFGGGLSTYGIIGLREPVEIALDEVGMIQKLGVQIICEKEVGVDLTLPELQRDFDVIVLSTGLGRTPSLDIEGEQAIMDGLEFIEASKTSLDTLKIGARVLVIGAGNTAIDCATIARRLGAEHVTIVYRRSEDEMTCYRHEYEFALREGIEFRFLSQPSRVLVHQGQPAGLECLRVELGPRDQSGRPAPVVIAGSQFTLEADQIIKAVGQQKPSIASLFGVRTVNGFIAVDGNFETSIPGVYAIGDCIRSKGAASTVMAVQDGKLAAATIRRRLQPASASSEAI
ncbi:NAD(P)-dependent oxidoreductase [Acidobacteria bacterium AB60]|nr:NAD(P)-dependent oxidoreductase [Acidobacteria bacterium AB60]